MLKVVVIEDEYMIRRGIILTIDWSSMDCVIVGEAANGQNGVELVTRLVPDIVITDVKMPYMNGVEMIAKLREQGCKAHFIVLTSYSDFTYAQSSLRLGVSDYLIKPLKDGELESAIKKIRNELSENNQQTANTDEPILRFHLEKGDKSKYVEDAIQYIKEHYNKEINISTVSQSLGISEGYLSRVFKKETSYTFTNYLTYYRIQLAMKMLKDYRLKVYEVADQIGYTDTAYFSSQFKKIVGVSPSEYQDRC